jgi:undecaprenyl pyrophosphate phosphatase UppP
MIQTTIVFLGGILHMDWLQAFILGFIQGLTEFVPISSTGHLYLGRKLFGLEEAGLFLDTMLHIGTLIALLVFYKEIILKLIKKPFSRLTALLVVGTIPAVIAGVLFSDFFDNISKTGVTIGWEFLVTGLFLWFADSIKNGAKKIDDLSLPSNIKIWYDDCRCAYSKYGQRSSGLFLIFIINTSYLRRSPFSVKRCCHWKCSTN